MLTCGLTTAGFLSSDSFLSVMCKYGKLNLPMLERTVYDEAEIRRQGKLEANNEPEIFL